MSDKGKAPAKPAAAAAKQPPAPDPQPTGPPVALVPLTATTRGSLLEPVAGDTALAAAFKRYVALKDTLLEDTDYIWSVHWQIGDQDDSKFFKRRAQAETYAAGLRGKGIECELEKKIKKSGCMKLGKAFGISDWPVEEALDRAAGSAYYKVRAEAPNGQYKERTGACDRLEKGKGKASFDTIMATALTRAADRAIMALLGGETTAEEFEGVEVDTPAAPAAPAAAPAPAKPKDGTTTCPRCSSTYGGAPGAGGLCPPCAEAPGCLICGAAITWDFLQNTGGTPPAYCAKCTALPADQQAHLQELNTKFTGKKPAKAATERGQHNKRLWVAAGALYGQGAEAKVAATCKARYGKASIKDLTDEQFKELALGVEGYARQKGVVQ